MIVIVMIIKLIAKNMIMITIIILNTLLLSFIIYCYIFMMTMTSMFRIIIVFMIFFIKESLIESLNES